MDEGDVLTAAAEAWQHQLRDRLGQWIEMGSRVKWLANGLSRMGEVIGAPREGFATVKEDKTKRQMDLPANRLTVVDAKGKVAAKTTPDVPEDNANADAVVPKATLSDTDAEGRVKPEAKNEGDQGFFDKVWPWIKNLRNPDGSRRPGREDGEGTETDPIFVGTDVNKAVELIMAGKHVRMSDEDVVPTVVAKLGPEIKRRKKIVNAMPDGPEKDAAKKALAINLCAVHVPGTNLFCVQHKDVKRVLMPQLSGKTKNGTEVNVQDKAVAMLESMNLIGKDKTVNPEDVRASQSELGAEQIDGMVKSYLNWLKEQDKIDALPEGDPKRAQLEADRAAKLADPSDFTYMDEKVLTDTILTTTDKYIIDGHHRWASMIVANEVRKQQGKEPLKMKVREVDMEVGEALVTVKAFADAAGIVPKAASGAEGQAAEVPKILQDSKVREAVMTWIQRSLQPIAASAVSVGDVILINGEQREILGVIAETSGGRSFITRGEHSTGISIIGITEQVVHVQTL